MLAELLVVYRAFVAAQLLNKRVPTLPLVKGTSHVFAPRRRRRRAPCPRAPRRRSRSAVGPHPFPSPQIAGRVPALTPALAQGWAREPRIALVAARCEPSPSLGGGPGWGQAPSPQSAGRERGGAPSPPCETWARDAAHCPRDAAHTRRAAHHPRAAHCPRRTAHCHLLVAYCPLPRATPQTQRTPLVARRTAFNS